MANFDDCGNNRIHWKVSNHWHLSPVCRSHQNVTTAIPHILCCLPCQSPMVPTSFFIICPPNWSTLYWEWSISCCICNTVSWASASLVWASRKVLGDCTAVEV
eukprot:GFUD01104853.1.p1 GENE.GFUD01104853.1~~GFUD01104853.1.p1  ORF type:complete len:103 (-),score=17.03 GFUD01104853.1:61-369(-)